ncbi:MAG: ISNCY family transposase [Thiohalomonadales bacterium]
MRVVKLQQIQLGEIDIADIQIDARSRDDIPAILKGLQFIFTTENIREKVFSCLENMLGSKIDTSTGRPGMILWNIFVLAAVKLGANCDYDRLQELANNHLTLRQMLGHSGWGKSHNYALQTLIDNVSLFTPDILMTINKIVVDAGHSLLNLSSSDPLKTRCDSVVVKTDIHYPTDISLLWDAMRKLIETTGRACHKYNISGWRQYRYTLRQLKKRFRKIQNSRASNSKDEEKKQARTDAIHELYNDYLLMAQELITKSEEALVELAQKGDAIAILEIDGYIKHAERQIDQIDRRVLKGEVIPHSEKVFSIFEPHTEWISKGKAGVPVEFGVRVCVLEDQHQFILHHRVMWQETDDKIAVTLVEEAKILFPALNQCSFDKGFYSTKNMVELDEILDLNVMPKKGGLNKAEKEKAEQIEFKQARRQHSAVESCINNLDQRGFDRCYSYGKDGFERHVGLSVVATNVHRIGLILQRQEREKLKKENQRAQRNSVAA